MKKNEWKLRLDDALSGIGENPRLYQQILRRAKEEEPNMKKKISLGLVAAAILAIVTMSVAAAAASDWNVLYFLFGDQKREMPDIEYTGVSQEVVSEWGASMRVESAVYDGRMLAFDYTIENTMPDIPMYCRVEDFTANDTSISTDFTDDFNEQWLPGLFSDGAWQDGELVLLSEVFQGAEKLHVELTVALYRPIRPVYWMEEFDPAEAQQKAEEGYYVIAEGEGFVGYDAEEGQWIHWFMGPMTEDMGEYREVRLIVSFDVAKPDRGFQALKTQKNYENERCTAQYETAEITPLGLYLTLNVSPKDDALRKALVDVTLTDGQGNSLLEQDWEKFWPTAGEVMASVDQNALLARFCWVGLQAEDLPDEISLTCVLDGGEKIIFPVQVR